MIVLMAVVAQAAEVIGEKPLSSGGRAFHVGRYFSEPVATGSSAASAASRASAPRSRSGFVVRTVASVPTSAKSAAIPKRILWRRDKSDRRMGPNPQKGNAGCSDELVKKACR